MYGFSAMLAYTLPGDRMKFYETSDMAKMRQSINSEVDDVTEMIGSYPTLSKT